MHGRVTIVQWEGHSHSHYADKESNKSVEDRDGTFIGWHSKVCWPTWDQFTVKKSKLIKRPKLDQFFT